MHKVIAIDYNVFSHKITSLTIANALLYTEFENLVININKRSGIPESYNLYIAVEGFGISPYTFMHADRLCQVRYIVRRINWPGEFGRPRGFIDLPLAH